MQFVDTNIFIRALANDDPVKFGRCSDLLNRAKDGKIELHTTESIITEVVYVLQSKRLYNLERGLIAKNLSVILKIKGIKISHKTVIISALKLYAENNIDFEDAVLISYTLYSKSKDIYSYDRGISKIQNIKRLEP